MKKTLSICLIIMICFALVSACAKSDQGKGEASPYATDSTAQTSPSQSGAQLPSDPLIIAESSNTISDKEKQEVLNDMSDQLDDALNGIGNLEDLDESDLNMDSIE